MTALLLSIMVAPVIAAEHTADGDQPFEVTKSVEEHFIVSIPAKVEFKDDNDSKSFEITAKGQIVSSNEVSVSSEGEFVMRNQKGETSLAKTTLGSGDKTVATFLSSSDNAPKPSDDSVVDLNKDESISSKVAGTVTFTEEKSGTWVGADTFTIKLKQKP